jgi:hypothetical protein
VLLALCCGLTLVCPNHTRLPSGQLNQVETTQQHDVYSSSDLLLATGIGSRCNGGLGVHRVNSTVGALSATPLLLHNANIFYGRYRTIFGLYINESFALKIYGDLARPGPCDGHASLQGPSWRSTASA